MSDLVSIIIPAYNAQEQIRETILSVLAQSYTNLQVIAVDDGSTDSTPGILAEIAESDSRLTVISKPNTGVSAARNVGIEAARGEWVMFVDSDDLVPVYAVGILLDAAVRTDADIAIGRVVRSLPLPVTSGKYEVKAVSPLDEIRRTLYRRGGNSAPWGKLYRRSTIGDLRFVEGIRYEDLEIFPRLYHQARRLALLDAPVYYYRPNPTSFINTFSPARFDALQVTDSIARYVERYFPDLTPAAEDRRLSAAFSTLALLAKRDKNDYPHVQQLCWDIIRRNRSAAIFSSHNRLRNKVASLLSFIGPGAYRAVSRLLS